MVPRIHAGLTDGSNVPMEGKNSRFSSRLTATVAETLSCCQNLISVEDRERHVILTPTADSLLFPRREVSACSATASAAGGAFCVFACCFATVGNLRRRPRLLSCCWKTSTLLPRPHLGCKNVLSTLPCLTQARCRDTRDINEPPSGIFHSLHILLPAGVPM